VSARIQAYLRTAAARDREVERVGPFTATFTRHSRSPYLNYAIPDDGANPTADDATALVEAFERHDRLPRLEYLPGLAPEVEPALLAAGFTVEDRLPLMECPPGSAVEQPVPDGFELLRPTTDEEHLALLAVQREAFGDGPPSADDLASARRQVDAGGITFLARDRASGDPAGAGACTPLSDGFTEVAGVGVREKYRRRGLGGVVTLHLTRAAHEAGAHTVFLTPAGDAQERVYARVGFRRIDSVLFLVRGAA
jgi:predicted N-acetyltransferase YhbS